MIDIHSTVHKKQHMSMNNHKQLDKSEFENIKTPRARLVLVRGIGLLAK